MNKSPPRRFFILLPEAGFSKKIKCPEEELHFMVSTIVFYLLKKGAHREPVRITTGEIASQAGVSQQTASRKIILLEKDGLLRRSSGKIFLTEKAVVEVRKLLKQVLESLDGTGMVFHGKAVKGLGEGGFYVSQKGYMGQFKKKLGFTPFKGTLNLFMDQEDVEKRLELHQRRAIEIRGFSQGGRRFGKIDAYRCMVGGLPSAIIFPEKSGHGLQTLEIISAFNLRETLGLSEGSVVEVEVVGESRF